MSVCDMTGLSRKVSTRTHVQAAFGPSQAENDQPHQLVTPVVLKRTCFARATLHVILHERTLILFPTIAMILPDIIKDSLVSLFVMTVLPGLFRFQLENAFGLTVFV